MTNLPDYEWVECVFCNGTGIDDSDFTGRCPICRGYGEREVEVRVYDDEDEEIEHE